MFYWQVFRHPRNKATVGAACPQLPRAVCSRIRVAAVSTGQEASTGAMASLEGLLHRAATSAP